MAASYSTGLRAGMMATGSFKSLMDGSFFDIYSGSMPVNADAAIGSATLLVTISNGGTGLTFDTSAPGGVLSKNTSETLSGNAVASGTGTFWRLRQNGDANGASSTALRVQGTVGVAGADMNLTDTTFASGAPQNLTSVAFFLPEA